MSSWSLWIWPRLGHTSYNALDAVLVQASITKHDASVDDLASVPWWAKEMGMTDTEYWSSLRECNQAASNATPDSRITPVQITQVIC